jgi:hypothetical protein
VTATKTLVPYGVTSEVLILIWSSLTDRKRNVLDTV